MVKVSRGISMTAFHYEMQYAKRVALPVDTRFYVEQQLEFSPIAHV